MTSEMDSLSRKLSPFLTCDITVGKDCKVNLARVDVALQYCTWKAVNTLFIGLAEMGYRRKKTVTCD